MGTCCALGVMNVGMNQGTRSGLQKQRALWGPVVSRVTFMFVHSLCALITICVQCYVQCHVMVLLIPVPAFASMQAQSSRATPTATPMKAVHDA